MPETDRILGEHGARLTSVEDDIGEIKGDVKSILAQLNQAKGGWKTLMLVAGIAGAMGAFATKLAAILGFFKP